MRNYILIVLLYITFQINKLYINTKYFYKLIIHLRLLLPYSKKHNLKYQDSVAKIFPYCVNVSIPLNEES